MPAGVDLRVADLRRSQVAPERPGRRGHGLPRAGQVAQPVLEAEPEGPPAVRQHLGRDLHARAEDAGNASLLVAHRRVGEGEVRFLRAAVPVHDQCDVVHLDRLAGVAAGHDGFELIPDLGPHPVERPPERPGVLQPEDLRVAVVVKHGAPGAPGDEHRLVRGEHHAGQRLERLRPALRWPQRRGRPVVGAHARAHLAAAGQERGRIGGRPGLSVHRARPRRTVCVQGSARALPACARLHRGGAGPRGPPRLRCGTDRRRPGRQ